MKKPLIILVAVVIVAVAAIWYASAPKAAIAPQVPAPAATSTAPSETPASAAQPAAAAPKTVVISISNFSFQPATLAVAVGTKVTWVNHDSMPHTVTAAPGGPQSGELAKGESYSFTFTKAGTYNYHCSIHPGMLGSVIVGQ